MSLALVFPGQGAQRPQMLPWLEGQADAAPTLQRLGERLGHDWRQRLEDTAWLESNRTAQLMLTGVGLAAWQCLASKLPEPVLVAGYSVGELAAFAAAGVFDVETALALAEDRAAAMTASVAGLQTGLLSVHGPRARALAQAEAELAIAILVADDRVIVGGAAAALERAAARWSTLGLRCTRLPVGIASHTPWMARAANAFARRLEGVALRAPRIAVVSNFSGTAVRNPSMLSHALARQIANPVRWGDCMATIAERRVRCVLEVGPGTTLSTLWRARHPEIPVRSIDEFRDVDAIGRWVENQLE